MHRLRWAALATFAAAPFPAAAEPLQVGGWFGPRLFSSNSQLGYIDDAPAHPELQNATEFGGRVARPFLPWLLPEFELPVSRPGTNAVGGARAGGVFWFGPRLPPRLELWPGRQIQPFAVIGGGTPVAL